jgi:protein disulfide-isomerase
MKKLAVLLVMCWAAVQVNAAEWLTNLPKAQAQAKSEKKLVLMEFTGSDWCPPCKALHKNVMTSPEFEAYAAKNLILVELDYPHSKPQAEDLKKANEALLKQYDIEGYPTVIVLDENGKQLSKEVGYGGEKPAEFIEKLEKLKKS